MHFGKPMTTLALNFSRRISIESRKDLTVFDTKHDFKTLKFNQESLDLTYLDGLFIQYCKLQHLNNYN